MFEIGVGSRSAFSNILLPESAVNQLRGCRSNQMHWVMDAVRAILLFTSRFNSPNSRRLLVCAHHMGAVLICDACAGRMETHTRKHQRFA
jgi:hypothetical protein